MNDGGPAFPLVLGDHEQAKFQPEISYGMSLRAVFAGQVYPTVVTYLNTKPAWQGDKSPDLFFAAAAAVSVKAADALIAALNKEEAS